MILHSFFPICVCVCIYVCWHAQSVLNSASQVISVYEKNEPGWSTSDPTVAYGVSVGGRRQSQHVEEPKLSLRKVMELVKSGDHSELQDMNRKLQRMLEETLTKNMHLQQVSQHARGTFLFYMHAYGDL